MATPNSKSQKAMERGRKDAIAGKADNPYLHLGVSNSHLAAWWDKGYAIGARQQSTAGERQ